MAFVPAPIQHASTSTPAPDVQALLRGDSDYAKSGAAKVKYVPKKYVPKAKVECVAGLESLGRPAAPAFAASRFLSALVP